MKLGIDEYTNLDSPFHRWDPRYKLIGLITLVFAFSFVRDLRMLLAMAAVTITIYAISRLPASFIVKRFRYPSLFVLAIVLTLPFLSVESNERSESIYKAMILRGYGHSPPPRNEFQASEKDTLALIAIILVTAGFIVGDIALGHNTATLLQ